MASLGSVSFTSAQDPELQAIERRRRLAEMLAQQAGEPTQVQPNAPISPLSGLAKALRGYTAGRGMRKADEAEKDYSLSYQKELANVLGGDLTSTYKHPQAQMLAAQLRMEKENRDAEAKAKTTTPMTDDEEKAAGLNPGGVWHKDAYGKPVPIWQPKEAEPLLSPEKLQEKKDIAAAGKPSVSMQVDTAVPFGKKLQEDMASSLVKNYDTLANTPDAIKVLDDAKTRIPKAGTFVGSGAELKLAAVQFLNQNMGTSIKPEQAANAEVLRSELFRQIMDNLKKMDAQPTQKQQDAMQNALGKLGSDPNALGEIIDITRGALVSKVKEHNRRVDQAEKNGASFIYDIRVGMPEEGGGADILQQADAIVNGKP